MSTENLLSHSRAAFEHATAKRNLKEIYQGKLVFVHAGGMWQAGPVLISTLTATDTEEIVLLDLYENPCKVTRTVLLEKTKQHWQEQMNAWLVEYHALMKKR